MHLCSKCKEEMSVYEYYRYPTWGDGHKETLCLFYYPHYILGTQYTCKNGHTYATEVYPSEESDKEYRIKNAELIRRQREYMKQSYNRSIINGYDLS
jgi:hypothetical protein